MFQPPEFSARIAAHHGTTVTVAVAGEIDPLTAPRFRATLHGAARLRPETIVVDLAAVDFMDSSGLHALLDAARRAEAEGRRLVLASPGPAVRRPLEIAGVLDQFHLAVAVPAMTGR